MSALTPLADETGRAHRFDLLDRVPDSEPITDAEIVRRFDDLQSRLLQRATAVGDLAAFFHLIQMNILMADRAGLVDAVREGYAGIGAPMESTGEPVFVDRSAHLIRVSEVLIRRVRLPGIVFRFDQDPDAMNSLRAVRERQEGSGHYFGSSADWFQNVITMSHYLGPLLGCITPRFWAFQSQHRALSVILLSLGMDINGFQDMPMEPMQLLPVSGPAERTLPDIHLRPTSCSDAIDWWVMRLNQMFGYLSDPTTFKDSNGIYAAHEHHDWMLTFGQVCALMTSLQCAGRDVTAQRAQDLANYSREILWSKVVWLL